MSGGHTPDDVRKVVTGLSPGQRKAILETSQWRDYREVDGRIRVALFRKNIFGPVAGPKLLFFLTPLGTDVRNVLLAKADPA